MQSPSGSPPSSAASSARPALKRTSHPFVITKTSHAHAVAFWLAAFLGGFISEAWSDCVITVGSSGGVFGMLGVFASDAVLNAGAVSYPLYRALTLIVFAVLWAVSTFQEEQQNVSHSSHVAGITIGALLGTLFLPSLPTEGLEMASPVAGAPSRQVPCRLLCLFTVFCLPSRAMECVQSARRRSALYNEGI